MRDGPPPDPLRDSLPVVIVSLVAKTVFRNLGRIARYNMIVPNRSPKCSCAFLHRAHHTLLYGVSARPFEGRDPARRNTLAQYPLAVLDIAYCRSCRVHRLGPVGDHERRSCCLVPYALGYCGCPVAGSRNSFSA